MQLSQKLAYIGFGILMMGATLTMSCQGPKVDNTVRVPPPTPDIHEIGNGIQQQRDALDKTTNDIRTNTEDGIKKTPPAVSPILLPHWTSILKATGVQEQIVKNLEIEKARADAAEELSKRYEKQYSDEVVAHNEEIEKRKAAEDNTTKELRQKYTAYSGILFFLMIGCALAAVFSPQGKALFTYASLACAAGCAAAIFVVQSVALIPWIVGGLALIVLCLFAYRFWKASNTEKTLNSNQNLHEKITKELVGTVEALKPMMTIEGRRKMLGDGPIPGLVRTIQSEDTRKLVDTIRGKMTNLAPTIPLTVAIDYNQDGVVDDRDVAYAQQNNFFRYNEKQGASSSTTLYTEPTFSSGNSSSAKKKASGRKIGGPSRAPIILK